MTEQIKALKYENELLKERIKALSPWSELGMCVMMIWPEEKGIEAEELIDMAMDAGVIHLVPGGYDPEKHICSPYHEPCELGDEWLEISPDATWAKWEKTTGRRFR